MTDFVITILNCDRNYRDSVELLSTASHKKIMIVDDEEDILTVTKMAIERCGYATEAYSDPFKALQKFKENPDDFSLVLTDIRMPSMDGFQLSFEIWKIKQDVCIMLTTAFDIDGFSFDKIPLIKKEDIVRKPFQPKRLCESINLRLQAPVL